MIWAAVIGGAAGCYLLKLAGLSVPDWLLHHPRVQHVAALLPVALLAALAATQTFTEGREVTIDARVAGVAAGIVAIRLRAPFLVIVGVAAATAALFRAAA